MWYFARERRKIETTHATTEKIKQKACSKDALTFQKEIVRLIALLARCKVNRTEHPKPRTAMSILVLTRPGERPSA